MDSHRRTRSRRHTTIVGAVLAATLPLSACTTDGPATSGRNDTVSPAPPASPGSYTTHSTTVDDIERTWNVYTPDRAASDTSPDAGPMPVVLVIHGTGDTGDGIRAGIGPDLEDLADREGFVIAYVDGYENNWNECRAASDWPAKQENLDDVGLMRHVVDTVHDDLGPETVDVDRTYAIGFSSGGSMAQRLAFEAPDLVSGVASVNSNIPVDDNMACTDAGEPVPVIFIQGREDDMNPFDGGEVIVGSGPFAESRGEVMSAVDSAEWFAQRNGVSSDTPETVRDGDAEITTWPGDNPVTLVAVDHSGHSFPTSSGRWGNDGGARYDAPGAIWEFFTPAPSSSPS